VLCWALLWRVISTICSKTKDFPMSHTYIHRFNHSSDSSVMLVRYSWLCSQLIHVLSSRSFRIKCDNTLSSLHTSSCGVLQDSVLGPLLFIMYTAPFISLISSFSLDHHLYADDTQLFFTFHPLNFDSSIFHFQNALQHITRTHQEMR